jgi:2-iminobutanoate/2-iminopropanoate deaminase
MKNVVSTDKAPAAIGAYSQAIQFDCCKTGTILFTSGQIPLDPSTGELVSGGIAAEIEQVMKNLKAVVEAGGSSMDKVLKATIFLADMGDFAVVNEVYGRYFPENPPARSAFQVAGLPLGVRVEIECIAAVG